MTKIDDFTAGAIAAPFVVAFLAAVIVYDGIWTMVVWNLVAPHFGIQKVTLALAIGIGCVVACFKSVPRPIESGKQFEFWWSFLLKGPIAALVVYVASFWFAP